MKVPRLRFTLGLFATMMLAAGGNPNPIRYVYPLATIAPNEIGCPTCPGGSASTGLFASSLVYTSSGSGAAKSATINAGDSGSISAYDPENLYYLNMSASGVQLSAANVAGTNYGDLNLTSGQSSLSTYAGSEGSFVAVLPNEVQISGAGGGGLFVASKGLESVLSATLNSALYFSGTQVPNSTLVGIGQDGSNDMVLNVPPGKVFVLLQNNATGATIQAGALRYYNNTSEQFAFAQGAGSGVLVEGAETSQASAVNLLILAHNTLTTTSAELVSVQNNGTETLADRRDSVGNWNLDIEGGALQFPTAAAGAPTQTSYPWIDWDGTEVTLNVPAGKFFDFNLNDVTEVQFTNNLEIRNSLANLSNTIWLTGVGAVAADPTNVNGQVAISHLAGGGGALVTTSNGSSCGTPSAANVTGTDVSGQLGITCGSAGTAGNSLVAITFANAYSSAPMCTFSAANATAAASLVTAKEFITTTTTQLRINCGSGVTCPSSGALLWTYVCAQ
jgi:hypothetical protein